MLLGAQLLQVLAWPFLESSVVGRTFLGVIGMVAVGSAVLAVRRTPNVSRAVLFLGAPAMVLTLLEAVFPDEDGQRDGDAPQRGPGHRTNLRLLVSHRPSRRTRPSSRR